MRHLPLPSIARAEQMQVYPYPCVCPRYHLLQLLTEVECAVPLPVQWHKQDSALHFVISVEHHGGSQHVQVKRQFA